MIQEIWQNVHQVMLMTEIKLLFLAWIWIFLVFHIYNIWKKDIEGGS